MKNNFRISLLLIAFIEMISVFAWLVPHFGQAAFVILMALVFVLALNDIKYALYAVFAELFIGSMGYLFSFEWENNLIPIRIGFWLILMSAWGAKKILSLKNKNISRSIRNTALPYFALLFIFIAWGGLNGYLRGNSFSNLFFDINGWFYFLLVFPVYDIFRGAGAKEAWQNIGQLFCAAMVWLGIKTLFLLFVFSHNLVFFSQSVYQWIRDTRVGEITQGEGGFYRIFFQSHIYILIAFFYFFLYLLKAAQDKGWKSFRTIFYAGAAILCLSVVLIGFSRSNWIGLGAGILIFFIYCIFWKKHYRDAFKNLFFLILLSAASILLIAMIIKFPYPKSNINVSTSSLFTQRAMQVTGEAGVSSRWSLLPRLWQEIAQNPILGQGFGATVSYASSDPRVLAENPSGIYTTYAFEWGFLDIWLKLGFFGLMAYLALVLKILITAYKKLVNEKRAYFLLPILAVSIISSVSFFSPYLNHPLGIGLIILIAAFSDSQKTCHNY